MRRDVGRHADGDADRAVDEQVRKPRRQHGRLFEPTVKVGHKADGVLFDVAEHLHAQLLQLRLGITVGGRRVAVHGAEVSVPVDKRVTEREILRQTHHGVVNRRVSVRVVTAQNVADGGNRLAVRLVGRQIRVEHRIQDTPLNRLQAVAHIGQRPADDHADGVLHEGFLDLSLDVYVDDFLVFKVDFHVF